MKATIFSSNAYVLFNGSPIEEFLVSRGLRQGDSLSLFLFTIVAEGLAGLVREVVNVGMFKGFKLNDNVSYNLV